MLSRIINGMAAGLLAAILVCGVVQAQTPPAGEPDPSFVEKFGTIDGRMAIINHSRWLVSDGWSNGDWMSGTWEREQVQETADGLAFTVQKSEPGAPKPYKNAEMRSKPTYKYGYFEVRMRVPRGSGLITGFFTFSLGEGPRKWQELDVEILGRDTRKVEMNIHHSGKTDTRTLPLGFDAADGFHTYGIEWRRDRVLWYMDGKLIHSTRGNKGAPIPTAPQQIYLSLWNSERLWGWAGGMDPKDPGPWTMTVQCIAYAQKYAGKPLC
jgi:endo-1,3-1,4-beta-glycanase ExoK